MRQWQLNLDRQDFLENYWQKKPLLIRGAISDFEPPIDADVLAGLAMEEHIESRIVEFKDGSWNLEHGPFSQEQFDRKHPWTLLVQAVDHYLPEVARLRKLVDFIPQWRLDDVMVSYAEHGGSVGPHFDNYDVFLLQGQGQRTWKIGQRCDEATALLPNHDLKILEQFSEHSEHLLLTGDMLYLPPGVAHWGAGEKECMTFSLGFRAPEVKELASRAVDSLLENNIEPGFYRDPESPGAARPGEITDLAIAQAKAQLLTALQDQEQNHWFGELVTEPKYPADLPDELPSASSMWSADGARLSLDPAVKLAWQQLGSGLNVYANGQCIPCSDQVMSMIITLCRDWVLTGEELKSALASPPSLALLQQLEELACLEFEQ